MSFQNLKFRRWIDCFLLETRNVFNRCPILTLVVYTFGVFDVIFLYFYPWLYTFSYHVMLVKQLVISNLDYCNSLYMNLPKTRLNKLRSILNGAVRFIYNIEYRTTDLVPFYKKAHILPIDQRIFFKVCLLTHKSVYGTAPGYLKVLLDVAVVDTELSNTRTRSKRPGDHLMLKVPKNKKSEVQS